MPRLLKDLRINDVSTVDRGAGEGVEVVLMKRDQQEGKMQQDLTQAEAHEFLRKRAADLRTGNETVEQSYVRNFIGRDARDEIGKRILELSESIRISKMVTATAPLQAPAIQRAGDDPPKIITGKASDRVMTMAKGLMANDKSVKHIGDAIEKVRAAHPDLRTAESAEHGIIC